MHSAQAIIRVKHVRDELHGQVTILLGHCGVNLPPGFWRTAAIYNISNLVFYLAWSCSIASGSQGQWYIECVATYLSRKHIKIPSLHRCADVEKPSSIRGYPRCKYIVWAIMSDQSMKHETTHLMLMFILIIPFDPLWWFLVKLA